MVLLLTGGFNDDAGLNVDVLVGRGASAYRNTVDGLTSIRAAIGYREFLDARRARKTPVRPAGIDAEAAAKLIAAAQGRTLTEREAKAVLRAYGLPVPAEHLATDAESAAAHARRIGRPVALKIESPDIPHKTEANAIRLDLAGEDAVRSGYAEVIDAARRYRADARIAGVLVQEMVPPGIEMMLGIVDDAVFGPVVAVGLGGIYVEVLRDVAYRLPPVDAETAHGMLRELKAWKILEGTRGKPRANVEALADCIVRCSWLAHDHAARIAELDVNPLTVTAEGAHVVDALLIVRSVERHGNRR
jgi:acyl-CoA synthetase (NDP forming)